MPGSFTLATCDADQVRVAVASIPISNGAGASGYADGQFLKISWAADTFITVVGTDGTVVRSKSNNRLLDIELTLLQSSVSNTALSALATIDQNQPNGAGIGSFVCEDLSGTTLVLCTRSWISKPTDITLNRSAEARLWKITGVADVFIAGNN